MRKIATLAGAALLIVSFASAGTAPSVRIVSVSPVTVVGSGYHAGATVRLSVSGPVRASRKVVVGPRGTFRVVFASIRLGRCTAAIVVTVTGEGRHVVKRLPAPDCPPLE